MQTKNFSNMLKLWGSYTITFILMSLDWCFIFGIRPRLGQKHQHGTRKRNENLASSSGLTLIKEINLQGTGGWREDILNTHNASRQTVQSTFLSLLLAMSCSIYYGASLSNARPTLMWKVSSIREKYSWWRDYEIQRWNLPWPQVANQ